MVGERVTEAEGTIVSATVVMLSAAGVYNLMMLWRGPSLPSSSEGCAVIAAITLLSTVLAMVGFFAAMRRLGGADAATFSTLEPIVTVLLAAIFLHKEIGIWQAVGGAIILCAVIVLARSGDSGKSTTATPGSIASPDMPRWGVGRSLFRFTLEARREDDRRKSD